MFNLEAEQSFMRRHSKSLARNRLGLRVYNVSDSGRKYPNKETFNRFGTRTSGVTPILSTLHAFAQPPVGGRKGAEARSHQTGQGFRVQGLGVKSLGHRV